MKTSILKCNCVVATEIYNLLTCTNKAGNRKYKGTQSNTIQSNNAYCIGTKTRMNSIELHSSLLPSNKSLMWSYQLRFICNTAVELSFFLFLFRNSLNSSN